MQKIGCGIEIKEQWIIQNAARRNMEVKIQDVFIYFYYLFRELIQGRQIDITYCITIKYISTAEVKTWGGELYPRLR